MILCSATNVLHIKANGVSFACQIKINDLRIMFITFTNDKSVLQEESCSKLSFCKFNIMDSSETSYKFTGIPIIKLNGPV